MRKIGFQLNDSAVAQNNVSNIENKNTAEPTISKNIVGNVKGKAVLYLRVSSPKQEDNFSLEAQEKMGRLYARNNNLEIVKIWKGVESGWGKKERKNFIQMLEYVKKHTEIRHILFDMLDRMTRNDFDKIKIQNLIKENDKVVHFTRGNKKYDKNSSSDDEFMMDIEVAVAKKWSNDISKKSRMGLMEKVEQGYCPSYAPIGYRNVIDKKIGKKVIEIYPKEAVLIKKLFEKVATGNYSMNMLAEDFYKAGLRNRFGGAVHLGTYYFIIRNPFYYGDFLYKGILYKGQHKPIVSKALWDKANDVLGGEHRPHSTNFAFSNMLRCDRCDCSILAEQKGDNIYYHCSLGRKKHSIKKYIKEEKMIEQFGDIILSTVIPKDVIDVINDGIKITSQERDNIEKHKKEMLTKEISQAEKELKKLCDMKYSSEYNNISDYEKKYIDNKINTLLEDTGAKTSELEAMGANTEEIIDKSQRISNILSDLKRVYDIADKYGKANIIKFILKLSKLNADNKIIPTFREPFDMFFNLNKELKRKSDRKDFDGMATFDLNSLYLYNNDENMGNIGVKTDIFPNQICIDNTVDFMKNSSFRRIGGMEEWKRRTAKRQCTM